MTTPPQRWALIGTGTISRSIAADLARCAGAEAVVVHSRDPEKAARFATEFGIAKATADYAAILADDSIDAIYLATPFATHHRMSREALLAGKHVLVEKPMAMSTAEVADLFGLAAAQGVFLMEAMWMKFTPGFLRLREEVARGRIGEVRSVRASFGAPFPEGGSRWDLAASGGALLDQGIYPVTLAHALLGSPESISARGTTRADGLDLSEHFTFEYPGGAFAQGGSSMVEFLDLAASVNGTIGWIDIPPYFWGVRRLEIHAGATQESFERPEVVEFDEPGDGYVPMLSEVIRAIDAGMLQHPEHDANATVDVFTLLDEIMFQVRQSAGAQP
ncbi:Gfo/Idh/MocA family protein [Agromyces albus]|uniref:Gfo/Idh/MocA family protein n=1 Tax=Agromyces albus TaxID=205332 RepID=UPI0013E95FF8|nr:Gfo/Idh/MocA family oxidoreductase [Agromyces albus]